MVMWRGPRLRIFALHDIIYKVYDASTHEDDMFLLACIQLQKASAALFWGFALMDSIVNNQIHQ